MLTESVKEREATDTIAKVNLWKMIDVMMAQRANFRQPF